MKEINILITICARGGSKGIVGKNIKLINGKPLIYYTLKSSALFKESFENSVDIVLSTDSDEITETVRSLKFDIDTSYSRPDVLATDKAGKIDAIEDVKSFMEQKFNLEYDFIVDLDVTSPLRTVEDLTTALYMLRNNEEAFNIFSVNLANRNPYFNMVEQNQNGFYSLSKTGAFFSRQAAPQVYDMNASFYIYKQLFFKENLKSAVTNKSLIFEMQHTCFDLDHPIDFDFMEYLLENNKLDFKLI
ncbi:cytidylyltransferase domain-containing protein [Dokdonia sp. Asnod1-B02]|uniref:acylneuraminate cytidylyltransferase family protein n=1 Tax=Dokdonia sp. Asnod1-B02 TaxID=3160573 RepID=UPI003863EA6C